MILKIFNKETEELVSISQIATFSPPNNFTIVGGSLPQQVSPDHIFELWTDDFTDQLYILDEENPDG